MAKKTISWAMLAAVVGTFLFIADVANGQEGMMKGKHEKGMMREGTRGEKHHRGMDRMGMMRGGHDGGHGFFIGVREELKLTDKQVERLRKLKSQVEMEMIRTRADLEIAEVELHDLLRQDKVDIKGVDAKIEKMGELRTGMHKAHIHARLDAQKILTAEQLKKHQEMKGKKRH